MARRDEEQAVGGPAWRTRVEGADREARGDLLDVTGRRAAGGDRAALEDLIWAIDELRLARSTIRNLVVNDVDAEDVEQDVLIAVAETIGAYRSEARFTTWLHAVARNKAIAHLRRRREAMALDDVGIEVGDAARISSMIATRTAVDEAIRALPDLYRPAVVLRDINRCSYDEVAHRLGLNLNTAKARVARGRALVAANLRSRP